MSRAKKDLEFEVELAAASGGERKIFKTFEEAVHYAIAISASRGGEKVYIDVLAWSKAAAKAYGGDYGVEEYEADPEASVHDRIVITAESQGRVA